MCLLETFFIPTVDHNFGGKMLDNHDADDDDDNEDKENEDKNNDDDDNVDDDDDGGLDPESGKLSGLEETETLHKVNVAIMLPNTPKRNAILYLCCKI